MAGPAYRLPNAQAQGRELAREGRVLWQQYRSVSRVATEMLSRHRGLPCLQAFRYAAGLSQSQAAERYNIVTDHQTTLGGTTVNAWETWARTRGAGSPPSFASLLVLSQAYGRGPLGADEEELAPGDLVADAYERLAPEDRLAISAYARARHSTTTPVAARLAPAGRRSPVEEDTVVIGPDFTLAVPTVEYGNPEVISFTLPNPRTGQLLDLPWDVFGFGVERLIRQIKNMGTRLSADLCFGINEAGLVIATFLSSAQFNRCPIGYLKCVRIRDELHLDEASLYPQAGPAPVIVVCDFEVKHADVVGFIARNLRARYPGAELHFAVFGAMTKSAELKVSSFSDLTGAEIMHRAGFASIFIAATMSPPGIEPPLELR
jgi:transcriptional regulator with XRE-family HTH domain